MDPAPDGVVLPVVWSPAALREVTKIFDYLVTFNPQAAARVFEALIAAGDSFAQFPFRGRLVPRSRMRELVSVYPYIMRYRVARDEIRILLVRHTARRPTKR
jgi:plasmid stabilization system protein ParE